MAPFDEPPSEDPEVPLFRTPLKILPRLSPDPPGRYEFEPPGRYEFEPPGRYELELDPPGRYEFELDPPGR